MLALIWFSLIVTALVTLTPLLWFLGSTLGLPSAVLWLLNLFLWGLVGSWFWREKQRVADWVKQSAPTVSPLITVLFILVSSALLASLTYRQHLPPQLVLHGAGAHDTLWHLALMVELDAQLPPSNPLLQGQPLQGYHYLNDLWWVKVHQITQVPLEILYLWVGPWVLSALFAATSLTLCLVIFRSTRLGFFGATLATWGAGFAYLAPLLFPQAVVQQSAFWLDQSLHYAVNQQLLLSLSVVNVIWLFLWLAWHNPPWRRWWWIGGLLLGTLTGIKIYAVLALLPALGLAAVYLLWRRQEWWLFGLVTLGTVLTGIIALISGSVLGFPFIWEPGWFLKTQFESVEHLNHGVWELQRLVYVEAGNWPRLLFHWGWALMIFVAGNFGPKTLGWFALPLLGSGWVWHQLTTRQKSTRTSKTDSAIVSDLILWFGVALTSLLYPVLLLQKGIIWNTIQFLHYAQIPLVLSTTWLISKLPTVRWQTSVIITLIILALPTTFQSLWFNLQPAGYLAYPPDLVAAYQALDVVPRETTLLLHPLYTKEADVPALAKRPVYWADTTILNILGVPSPERKQRILDISLGKSNCVEGEAWASPSAEKQGKPDVFTCPISDDLLPRYSDPATGAAESATAPTTR